MTEEHIFFIYIYLATSTMYLGKTMTNLPVSKYVIFCRDETLGSARHLHMSDKFCHYVILSEN